MLEYVDVATARSAGGVRIVVTGLVPSPWSEATKGLFRLAGVPVRAVRRMRDATELNAWTGIDNVPVVLHDAEPARSNWAAITALAARLAGPGVLLPDAPAARADAMGLLEQLAGEDGLGWNARLEMIDASITSDGARGFPLPVARNLAARYGYAPGVMERSRARAAAQLELVRDRLRARTAAGDAYLAGPRPGALDVYVATFLTPLSPIPESDCPGLLPVLRQAFGAAHEALGHLVGPELAAHRRMMFERHLAWPIEL